MTEAVLNVLAQSEVLTDRVVLPPGQLDRKLYEKVNETLVELGGKWNTKQKAHLFSEDPRPLLKEVLDSGQLPDKNPLAFFPTPRDVAEEMIAQCPVPARLPCRILDPSAGRGHIAQVIREQYSLEGWADVTLDLVELDTKRAAYLAEEWANVFPEDFLTYEPIELYDRIYMNPPFSVAGNPTAWIDHIERAFAMLKPNGLLASVVPNSLQFRNDKKHSFFRLFAQKYGDTYELWDDAFKESGTGIQCSLLFLDRSIYTATHGAEPYVPRPKAENHGSQTRPETAHLLRKVEEPVPPGHYKTVTGEIKPLPTVETKQQGGKREKFVSKHTKSFTFPNGDTVEASYVRFDPRIAQITFTVGRDRIARFLKPVQKDTTAIEWLMESLLVGAYAEAILWEQKERLKRATPPNQQPLDKSLYTMSAEAAKFYAGWYALCEERGGKWIPQSKVNEDEGKPARAYEDIGLSVFLWKKMREAGLDLSGVRLCGCCRYERRWVRLQYDPLVGQSGYGEEASCPTSLTGDSEAGEAVSTGEPPFMPTEARLSSSPPFNATTSQPTASGSKRLKREPVQV